ncbi:MAG: leucine-rich repeat domain-containing protein, partial [Clostridia bacterium]|nr:leucine-rich repeat domain-containing protein [Clostridia bacterium]
MNCNNLEEITIPKSLTHISSQAFEGCASLYTVYCGHTEKAWASVVIEDGNESFVDAHKFFTNPSGECGENLTWELDGGVLTISGMGEMTSWSSAYETPWNEYMSEIYSVEISDGVTSIGEFAFAELINLSDVSIPSSVSYIGMNAFEMDLSLMQITIPDGVSTIESFAFSDTGISEITLPASVEMLGDGVFYRCDSLVAINVDESNEFFASDEYGVLYDKYYTELICCPSGTQMTEYSVNENVSFMRNFAFANCSSLETVEIQENDAGVSEISMGLFMDCTSLKTVYIPGYVMIIGDDAFGGCESLADIYYGNTEEVWYNNVSVGGGNDFSNVTFHFEDPVIDSGVCGDNLEWVLNNDNVLIISGYGDMYSWSYDAPWAEYVSTIRTVIFDGEITSIGDTAFAGFAVMPDIILPETLVTIGNEAFLECESLPMIMIPDSVTSIGEFAFKGCNSLSRIDVSENNTTYSSDEYGVLYSADKSKLIEVPAGFMESEYTVADGTKIIESYAFMNTMRVTSVILPDSVTTI